MTKNFNIEEFQCKCGCGLMKISPTIVLICQMIRDKFNKPVTVISGCRCDTHNEAVGGVSSSQHKLKGDDLTHACDVIVKDIAPRYVYGFLNESFPNTLGVGIYDTFTHFDDRMDRHYRWDNRSN